MRRIIAAAALMMCVSTGCGSMTYDDFVFPDQEKDTLVPSGYSYTYNDYSGTVPAKEETIASFSSDDGICVINRKENYYEATLDLSSGNHYLAGAAYAEAVLKADAEYEKKADQYIHDMIVRTMPAVKKANRSEVLKGCIAELTEHLPNGYKAEIEGFASAFSNNDVIANDEKLSRTEACILQFIPDLFGPPSGCAVSVGGKRTDPGGRFAADIIYKESVINSSFLNNQCVLHLIDNDSHVISVNTIGLLNTVTAVNDKGVSAAVMKAKSPNDISLFLLPDDSERRLRNRSSFSFALRKILESSESAESAGNAVLSPPDSFTYNCNVFITDNDDALTAEIVCDENSSSSILRTEDTPILAGLEWECQDCICAVNAFVSRDTADIISTDNIYMNCEYIHWIKLNSIFRGNDKISLTRFKELMTIEKTDVPVNRIREDDMLFMLITDHEGRTIQADFIGAEGLSDMPVFSDLGSF